MAGLFIGFLVEIDIHQMSQNRKFTMYLQNKDLIQGVLILK